MRCALPQRRAHELRAAERAGPVALSRVLCGAGACALTASEAEAELACASSSVHAGEQCDLAAALAAAGAAPEALRMSDAPCAVRSRGGYRTVLSTHGLHAGAFYAEVALPRLPAGAAAARLGWAADGMPLDGPVGAAAAAVGDAEAEAACAGVGVRGATGQALRAGRAPGPLARAGPTFGQDDTVRGPTSASFRFIFSSRNAISAQVGLYVYQPPCGREAALGAPRDVVSLAHASGRAGLFIAAPPQPDAAALVPGSAVLYRVGGGGRWALVARDCLPRRPLHLAISLFTDTAAAPGTHALAVLNPGPHFAFPPPSADELAEAAARGAMDDDDDEEDAKHGRYALVLPAPRALCELGLGAEEWLAQREAAAAPAEPEGEQYGDDDNDAGARSGEEAEEARPDAAAPATDAAHDAARNGPDANADGAPAPSEASPLTGVALLLAAAAAAAAARLGLAMPLPSGDAL